MTTQELELKIHRLKDQLAHKDEVLRRKNLELDALHFVWCNGGCITGVHRWRSMELTEEIVAEAERNTKRLRTWFNNATFREEWLGMSPDERREWQQKKWNEAPEEVGG